LLNGRGGNLGTDNGFGYDGGENEQVKSFRSASLRAIGAADP
jgi:hypothetical protein